MENIKLKIFKEQQLNVCISMPFYTCIQSLTEASASSAMSLHEIWYAIIVNLIIKISFEFVRNVINILYLQNRRRLNIYY